MSNISLVDLTTRHSSDVTWHLFVERVTYSYSDAVIITIFLRVDINPGNIAIKVSFFSTSPELSNKARFEYFTRTIPSDLHQVRAMVEIVKQLGWRYVSIVYEESNYGIKVS